MRKRYRTSRLNIETTNYKQFSPEIKQISAKIMNGMLLSHFSVDTLQEAAQFLQFFKTKVIETQDYMYAQQIEDKLNEINVNCEKMTYEQHQGLNYDFLCDKIKNAELELDQSKANKLEFIQKFNDEKDEAVCALLQRQEEEIENLDREIDGTIPYQFDKYSSGYLNQRKKQQSLVSAKFYRDAYYMKKDTDKLQQHENEQNIVNWHSNIETRKENLQKLHQQQMHCLIEKFEKTYVARIRLLDEKIQQCQATYISLKNKANSLKFYNSPGTRKTKVQGLVPIPEHNLTARMSRIRTSNYQYKTGRCKTPLSRPRTALY